jgi:hypothetical protein
MKVTTEHLEQMRTAIEQWDTPEIRQSYIDGKFARADAVKDLDMRYRWDLYWHCVRKGSSMPDSTCGYNTNHIDTALRAIVPALKN